MALALSFSYAGLAVADDSVVGIKVQPSIIEERVDPGQVFNSVLHATNIGQEAQTFYVVKRDISGLSSDGQPNFALEGEATGFELSSWIKVREEPIVVLPGETKNIPFSIVIPENALPGAHLGAILMTTSVERPKETGISIGYQVATIINLRMSGDIVEAALLREFYTDKSIYNRPEVKFITRVENLGNTVVKPRGPIEISNMFGKNIATLIMNDSVAAILPEAARYFEAVWLGDGLSFGRYQAVLSLAYGEDEWKTISQTVSFWILPLNIILSTAGSILGLIIVIFVLVKLYIKKKLFHSQQTFSGSSHSERLPAAGRGTNMRREGGAVSRVMIFTVILIFFIILFLAVLFFLFA